MSSMFEMDRLAVSLVDAIHTGDEGQVLAVLASVTEPETGAFLTAIAGMVERAVAADPAVGIAGFVAAYRAALDRTEEQLGGAGNE